MNDIFEDSEVEKPDITKKNWASVSAALKKHNDDMSELRSELTAISQQFNALVVRVEELDQRHTQMIALTFDGGPTAE
jgi:hypothetical protein